YLSLIGAREDQDLEVSSEFLEMAARLVHIKTVMLLPRHEEEADELRAQLTGELMEYRLCRLAAERLGLLAAAHRVYVRAPMAVEADCTYALTHPASLLCEARVSATGRAIRHAPPPESAFSGIVRHRTVSVASRIIHLLRKMYRDPTLSFDSIFCRGSNRSELVATFLALLELIKSGRVSISEDGNTLIFHKQRKEQPQEVCV
ncbi:MAG: ScpA family protein, partial [Oscillospiraceae bacterium]